MTSRGRGRGQRGRGRANLYYTEFPTLNTQTSNSSASSSQPTVKDVLLLPEQYIPNVNVDETVLFIEQNDEKWMKDPWEIKRRYLTTQQSPPRFNQYRYVYEQIIIETASMDIKHTLHDPTKTRSPIQYSKTTTKSIMPFANWGINPHTTRTIDSNHTAETRYSYWDYIDSFTQVFYYQNPIHNHTWFIQVCPDVLKNEIPN